ncbi:GMC family oxidoreductase [Nocardioides sp. P86]|uniref:GMC family oxidoreductase n=1 Tax=Nocardioides sp. P86 TaxID=2939569 RepID=UPI00204152A0|nr:GMC family oxidoreductase N-terminal domain-containing protein [Nocardioides sp. P86]MCM3516415.1 GMC family oxidoreductase N-terminal domain-containing protein [Nocardioides sp. P86]
MAERESFDYVVVGAGSGGAVVAARLTEDPSVSVLLLEAGGAADADEITIPAAFANLFKTRWDWNYTTTEQKQLESRRAYWPRMKALGGCSSMNAMIYIRGNHADFDTWRDAHGATGWGHADVLPYFVRSEGNTRLGGPHHGQDGPLHVEDRRYTHPLTHAFVDAAVASGFKPTDDFNGAEQEGAGLYQVTQRKGRRWSVAKAYLEPAADRPNLTVRTGAFVEKVLVEGGRAVGVSYQQGPTVRTAYVEAEVVLAGGAVNSPQLLMLSGIGPGAHLREVGVDVLVDLPGVGQNLHDHPAVPLVFRTRDTTDLMDHNTLVQFARAKATGTGPLVSNVGEGGGFWRTRDDLAAPDLQVHVAPTGFYDNGLHEPTTRNVTLAPTLVHVASRGSVRLRSTDPRWHPDIDPGYYDDQADLDAMTAGVRRMLEVAATGPLAAHVVGPGLPTMQGWGADPTDAQIVEHVRAQTQTLYHPVGTCAMGSDERAVVDPELRVRGVAGLRVADASVMPMVTRGNTNAPSIMIGERAADLLRGRTAAGKDHR